MPSKDKASKKPQGKYVVFANGVQVKSFDKKPTLAQLVKIARSLQ